MIKIVVLVSGRGSNLRAICGAIDAGTCRADIVGVIADRKKAAALEYAERRGIPVRVVALRMGDDRDAWNRKIAAEVATLQPDLVVLAGFMRVLAPAFIDRFAGRIINVHPAILPAFPGHNATEQAIAAGVRLSGCTVHVVDAGVDTGPIIAQSAVTVLPEDTPDSLHARIQVQEHILLPQVIDQISSGEISLHPLTFRSS